ncbi:hypothetical protein GEMRC1_013141 [Eukaryota sp. GEM-RC1]
MHPKEISNFLLNHQRSTDISHFFKIPSRFRSKPAQPGVDVEYSVAVKLQELLQYPTTSVEFKDRSITYIQSDCLSSLFSDALKVAVLRNIELNIRNVLICNWETSFSSLVAVMSDSLVSERLIVGYDQLRFSVREEFLTFMKNNIDQNFKISVIGCGTDFVDNTHCVLASLPP